MRSSRLRASVPARLGVFAAGLALVSAWPLRSEPPWIPVRPGGRVRPARRDGPRGVGLSLAQGDTAISPATFAAARRRGRCASASSAPTARLRSGFEVEAERRLHLILVRRDLTGYQHLHPAMAADGTWSCR